MERWTMDLFPKYHVVVEHKDQHGIARITVAESTTARTEKQYFIPCEVLQAIGAVLLRQEFCHHQDFMVMGNISNFAVEDLADKGSKPRDQAVRKTLAKPSRIS